RLSSVDRLAEPRARVHGNRVHGSQRQPCRRNQYRDRRDPVLLTGREMSRTDGSAPAWRSSATWCALCALAVLFHAADARPEAIGEGDDQSVLLAPQDVGSEPNDHPVSLDIPEIERMLEGLRFTHADETDASPAPVFNTDQVRILGEALADGL